MKLFIDDIRVPSDVGFNNEEWLTVRTPGKAMLTIMMHKPQTISFDHDLGWDNDGNELLSGYDIAKWLVDTDLNHGDYITEDFQFTVHSANPVGAENIGRLLKNYVGFKKGKK